MFHRVEMNIIEMCLEVVFIFNRVLPKSPLPDAWIVNNDKVCRAPCEPQGASRLLI